MRKDCEHAGIAAIVFFSPLAQLRKPFVGPSSVVELEVPQHDVLFAAEITKSNRLAGVSG